ncbi:hypothetical protein, partial [Acinetobacter sp. 226-4]|uniref:hypothetical protein n=1 Tax=Acinetobacter sp. 226-4 TaxID=2746719 RepID=UPI0025749EF2
GDERSAIHLSRIGEPHRSDNTYIVGIHNQDKINKMIKNEYEYMQNVIVSLKSNLFQNNLIIITISL